MALQAAISDRLSALVHGSAARQGALHVRHVHFIAIHLALALAAFMALPVYLLASGRPGLIDVLTFGWALFPLLAVLYVSRSGDLQRAHVLAIAGLIGAGVTLSIGAPGISPAAALWLTLAPVSALLAFSLPMVLFAGAAALAGVFGVALFKMNGVALAAAPVSQPAGAMLAALAIVFACAVLISAIWQFDALRRGQSHERARSQAMLDALGDLVLRADRSGAVKMPAGKPSGQSALAEAWRGFDPSARDLAGRGLFERIHVADRPLFLKSCADAADGDAVVLATLRLRAPEARYEDAQTAAQVAAAPAFLWIEMRIRCVQGMDGARPEASAQELILVLRDVTQLIDHAASIESARQKAEDANRWKDRFLANVSHELRTPLNAIIGFAEFLGNESLAPAEPAKRCEYANIIRESGEHLLSVVNTILDMSKIEAGNFELLTEPFELMPLLDQCCNMISLKAESGGIELKRDYSAIREEMVADKRAVKQIIINLLSNAVKFTPQGGRIGVAARRDGNSVVFTISDTGIGILPSDLGRLGDPFFQARGSYDRPYEGTGLGLSVVRGLVGLHGGTISIESAHTKGTKVIVRMPLDCQHEACRARTSAKIEAVPRFERVAAEPDSTHSVMVKKIA